MSAPVDVLLVEDEVDLAAVTRDYLEAFGLHVLSCPDAESALRHLRPQAPGVALLDVNLPGMSGFELCQHLRDRQVPVIFVSARGTDVDQVHGLSLGADDFVTKPFSLAVLLAKVRRALERGGATGPTGRGAPTGWVRADFDDGRLRVELSTGRTYLAGHELHLTTLEDRILAHLVSRRGTVCTKEEIIRSVWGDEFTTPGTLTVHVRRLRARIEKTPESPTYIHTVWGRGYLFEAR
ncbi:response regulator transcription factor [Actinomyces sp. oral taxon 897]|uniref:response regulator transcription factor n=1 Tax=Actinomyces sp. oral taxon 897 TaxID=2081702 RepID=UPI000D04813C|nr:response regulator transcription factor [Actinomyces sp. oral taxon 897]AVM60793.1 DNA-binding response regulator [Actinomyces sp. oral taxon 897]